MAEINAWDPTDNNNVDIWPEGQLGGTINDAGRAMQGLLARWYRDTNGSVVASNVGNAFSIISNRSIPALFDNLVMVFTANITNSGPSTLNLNGLGAKPIVRYNLTELAAGDIISNTPIAVLYKLAHDKWFMTNAPAAFVFNMFGDFSENAAPGNPAVNTARLYAFDDGGGITLLGYRDSSGLVTPLRNAAIIQRAYAETVSLVDCTSLIPFDDTIPQNTEGTEALTCSITPQRASNRVRATFSGWVGGANNGYITTALFRDSVANALDARGFRFASNGGDAEHVQLVFEHSPGVAVATTYKIRIGSESSIGSGLASSVSLNGGLASSAGRKFGGASRATLVLEEIVA